MNKQTLRNLIEVLGISMKARGARMALEFQRALLMLEIT